MIRRAKAVWRGTGRAGNGHLSTDSGVCPLYSRKRTLVERVGMSALCQKRTSRYLFDYLVSAQQERLRDRQAECLGSSQIDDEFKLGRLFNWKVSGLRSLENLVDNVGRLPE